MMGAVCQDKTQMPGGLTTKDEAPRDRRGFTSGDESSNRGQVFLHSLLSRLSKVPKEVQDVGSRITPAIQVLHP